jgi:CheY-like chemotaxis protein
MSQLLRLNGHHVHTAHDGQQAVALAIREQPDVVLLDIGLPILNGYDACRAIRNAGLHDSLIVAMTGYGQPDDRKLSREANFDAHLVKPVDFATIIELIRQKELASL